MIDYFYRFYKIINFFIWWPRRNQIKSYSFNLLIHSLLSFNENYETKISYKSQESLNNFSFIKLSENHLDTNS